MNPNEEELLKVLGQAFVKDSNTEDAITNLGQNGVALQTKLHAVKADPQLLTADFAWELIEALDRGNKTKGPDTTVTSRACLGRMLVQYLRAFSGHGASSNSNRGTPRPSLAELIRHHLGPVDGNFKILDLFAGPAPAALAFALSVLGPHEEGLERIQIEMMDTEEVNRASIVVLQEFKQNSKGTWLEGLLSKVKFRAIPSTFQRGRDFRETWKNLENLILGLESYDTVLQFHGSRALWNVFEGLGFPAGTEYGRLVSSKFKESLIVMHEISPAGHDHLEFNEQIQRRSREIIKGKGHIRQWPNGCRDGILTIGARPVVYPCSTHRGVCPKGTDQRPVPTLVALVGPYSKPVLQKRPDGRREKKREELRDMCRPLKFDHNSGRNPCESMLFWFVAGGSSYNAAAQPEGVTRQETCLRFNKAKDTTHSVYAICECSSGQLALKDQTTITGYEKDHGSLYTYG